MFSTSRVRAAGGDRPWEGVMRRKWVTALGLLLPVAFSSPALASHTVLVDDDRAQCASAQFSAIQDAVAAADPGSTIRVCRGTYTGTVLISGPEKNGLQLVAQGIRRRIVLDGNFFRVDGIVLSNNVTGVLLEGFTIRNYRQNILLNTGASGNTIRGNVVRGPTQFRGIAVRDAHGNLIEENVVSGRPEPRPAEQPEGEPQEPGGVPEEPSAVRVPPIVCGICLFQGSSKNVIRGNTVSENTYAGILLEGSGRGNEVIENEARGNGLNGILNDGSDGTLIEDNKVINNEGVGIRIGGVLRRPSNEVRVVGNRTFNNGSFDLFWDGLGTGNRLEGNDEPQVLRLLAVTEKDEFVDTGAKGPSAGDVFVSRESLYRWAGRTRGHRLGHVERLCTVTGPSTCAVTATFYLPDRKSTRLNSSHIQKSRMPSSA